LYEAAINYLAHYIFLAASGQNIKSVQVNFYDKPTQPSDPQKLLYQITLEDVRIVSIQTTSSCPNCPKPLETISMNYGKITWKDLPFGSSQGWDVRINKTL
jgi:type VI secretion system Hcp family effector